ncbi:PAS domain-containing protein [Candidatus Peregrinibacteria bacterium]|nr:PAS domain-containing protein [Candidatus Peregrinibacteria bacterium]
MPQKIKTKNISAPSNSAKTEPRSFQFLRDLSLRFKLLMAFNVIIAGCLFFSLYINDNLSSVQTSLSNLNADYIELQNIMNIENNKEKLTNFEYKNLVNDPLWTEKYHQAFFEFEVLLSQLKIVEMYQFPEAQEQFERMKQELNESEQRIAETISSGNIEQAKELFNTEFSNQEQRLHRFLRILVLKKRQEIADTLGVNVNVSKEMRKVFVLFIAIFLFIGLILAYLLTLIIVKPLKKIAATAESISAGNLENRVKYSSHDEIGTLTAAFNEMTDKLQKSYERVQEQVRIKTKELSETLTELQLKNLELEKRKKVIEEEKERVQEERDKTETILQSIGDGVFVLNTKYEIILFNEVAEHLTGFPLSEVVQKKYSDYLKFTDEKNINNYNEFITNALKTGNIEQTPRDSVLLHKKGEPIPIASSAAPIKDISGKVIGCVVVFRDVTKERELNKIKNEFLSLASHQLRTPLGSMRWNMELLLGGDMGEITDPVRKTLGKIYSSNQRIISLINDLLDVSRIDSGKIQDTPIPTNVVQIIENVLKEMEGYADERKIALSVEAQEPSLPHILVDPKLFREVIQNLVSNAVKFNRPQGIVRVVVQEVEKKLQIDIIDTGMGIPRRDHSRLFGKFYRGENATRSTESGTGLGLYLVKSYVEKWGGSVGFESEENKGSTFSMVFPTFQKS